MDRYSNLAARVRGDDEADTATATPAWISALNALANPHPIIAGVLGMVVYIGLLIVFPWTRTGPYILGLFSIPMAVVSLPSLVLVALALFGVIELARAPKRLWLQAAAVWWSSLVLVSCALSNVVRWPTWVGMTELMLLILTVVFVVRARMVLS